MRTCTYLVYDSVLNTANLVAEWTDASPPQFSISAGRYSDMTIHVPRTLGGLREPNETGTDSSLQVGYRVDCYVASDYTSLPTVAAGSQGTLVYRGTIEQYRVGPDGADVRVVALHRIVEQANVPAADAASDRWEPTPAGSGGNYPPNLAKSAVDTFIGTSLATVGVIWDSTNPVGSSASTARGSGAAAATVYYSVDKTTVAKVLDDLIALQGKDWLWYVSPESKVVFIKPDTSVINHYLTNGVQVVAYDLTKDFSEAVRKVTVTYSGGSKHTETAADYTAADPRWIRVEAPELDAAGANQLAEEIIADRDRVRLTGSITISGERYPIESLRLGQTVQFHTDSPLPTDSSHEGYNTYDAETLVITGLAYTYTEATITLTQPARTATSRIKRMEDDQRQLRGLLIPFHDALTRPATATTVGAAGAGDALPATPEGYFEYTINGTTYKIPYYNT